MQANMNSISKASRQCHKLIVGLLIPALVAIGLPGQVKAQALEPSHELIDQTNNSGSFGEPAVVDSCPLTEIGKKDPRGIFGKHIWSHTSSASSTPGAHVVLDPDTQGWPNRLPEKPLREKLASDFWKYSQPGSHFPEVPYDRPPWARQQSSSGKGIRKGGLILGLAGLGIMGAGAYLIATTKECAPLQELFAGELECGRRRTQGIGTVAVGAVVATFGFIYMKK